MHLDRAIDQIAQLSTGAASTSWMACALGVEECLSCGKRNRWAQTSGQKAFSRDKGNCSLRSETSSRADIRISKTASGPCMRCADPSIEEHTVMPRVGRNRFRGSKGRGSIVYDQC